MRKIPLIISFILLLTGIGFGQENLHTTKSKHSKKSSKKAKQDTSKTIQSDGTLRISTTNKGRVKHKPSSARSKPLSKRKASAEKEKTDSAR